MGKAFFVTCVPIPAFIPTEIALDVLHEHSQIITANSLVLDHRPIQAPENAAKDELSCSWYEITERIQYLPGLGKMGSGKISFNGCFHNVPWGLQTHIHAPMGVDLRVQYRIAGEVAGVEVDATREIGLADIGAPAEGLYLRADAEIKSSVVLSGFVKAQLKTAVEQMVQRVVQKAERVDADMLQQMISQERLTRNATIRKERSLRVESEQRPLSWGGGAAAAMPPVAEHVH